MPLSSVQYWLSKAAETRLDRVNFTDTPPGRPQPVNRTAAEIETIILELRQHLAASSVLGEFGAEAIHQHLRENPSRYGLQQAIPSVRTINRILQRWGQFDARHRRRHPPPPRGWYLPLVSGQSGEVDQFDAIEGLVITGGIHFDVLTAISLHGGLVNAWPTTTLSAVMVLEALIEHWRAFGLPAYAQFDNATIFQGPHQHREVISRVMRACLSLQVTPVFAPVRETGMQGSIESFNGRWQQKLWQRSRFTSMEQLQQQSSLYVQAYRERSAARRSGSPARRAFPSNWTLDLQQHPQGRILYVRRTDEQGRVTLLGHSLEVSAQWVRRLVRCEVRLDEHRICCYALRRREPMLQPLLAEIPFQLPVRPFKE